MIEKHFGKRCLVKESTSPTLLLICKGSNVNISGALPSDMSELIFLTFMNLYRANV